MILIIIFFLQVVFTSLENVVLQPSNSLTITGVVSAGKFVRVDLDGGRSARRTVLTDQFGEYQFKVSPGIYHLTFSLSGCNPIHLASFEMQTSNIRMPEIRFEPCGIMESFPPQVPRAAVLYDLKEDSFKTDPSDKQSELIVRYAHRFENLSVPNSRVLYRGMPVSDSQEDGATHRSAERSKYFGVMISYRGLLIYADTVYLDKKTLMLEAEGNVDLFRGNQLTKANRVEIDFRNADLLKTMKVTPTP